MEFASSVLERLGPAIGVDALPTWKPRRGSSPRPARSVARDYPFILNSGSRLPMFIHSRTYRLPWTRGLRPSRPPTSTRPTRGRSASPRATGSS